MYFNIDLLSNGKMGKDYPIFLPVKIMKISHYKELKNASELEYDVFEPVISSVLDNTIDWSRVEGIKTVDDLIKSDRLKLLFFQILNSRGGDISYTWDCGDCNTSNRITFNIENLVEYKLKKEVKDVEYKSNNGNIITIAFPRFRDHLRLDIKIKEYQEEVFNKIKEYIKPILDIQEKIEVIKKKINFARITANPEITNEDKIKILEEEMKGILETLENIINDEDNSNKVKDILKKYNLFVEEIFYIKSYKDLKFTRNLAEDLVYYAYIKDNNMELNEYFEYMNNIDAGFLNKIDRFIENSYCGFEDTIDIQCSNLECKRKDKVRLDLSPKFFFSEV